MDAKPLHIVDVVAEIGLKQDRSIDQSTGLEFRLCNAADANKEAASPAELALEQQQITGRQQCGVAHVKIGVAPDSEGARVRSANHKGKDVPLLVEATFRNGDQ